MLCFFIKKNPNLENKEIVEEKQSRKIQNTYDTLNFPALDFLVLKKKSRDFKKIYFCRILPFIHTYLD